MQIVVDSNVTGLSVKEKRGEKVGLEGRGSFCSDAPNHVSQQWVSLE